MSKRKDQILIAVIVVSLLVGTAWFVAGNQLALTGFFAPKMEQVRRNTFEESKAYRDGAVQELRAMQFEYIRADEAHREALASIIRHRAAGLPYDAVPADLQEFLRTLQ